MENNDRNRILSMLSEGKITVKEAERLLSALEPKKEAAEGVAIKDTRGRKPKKLKVVVDSDSGSNKDAKVNINIPISLLRTVGPLVARNMPKDAKEKLDESGVNLGQIFEDVESLIENGLEEDIVNIDTGDDKTKVRVYVE